MYGHVIQRDVRMHLIVLLATNTCRYLRCDPSRHPLTPQLDNAHTRTAVRYTNILMNFVGQLRTRFVMFGPGLETRAGKIVRHILTDEHMHDLRTPATTGPLKVTGMMPGETAGLCVCATDTST